MTLVEAPLPITAAAAPGAAPAAAPSDEPAAERAAEPRAATAEAAQPADRVVVQAPESSGPVVAPASLLTAVAPPPPPPAAQTRRTSSDPAPAAKPAPSRSAKRSTAGTPAPARQAPAPAPAPSSGYAAETVAGVNAERTARGLSPLSSSGCAQAAAQRWAEHLASSGQFAHQNVGALLGQCGARAAGENIAQTADGPASMVSMWMGSPGHRANILDASFTHVGSAAVKAGDGTWIGVHVFLGL